MLARRAAPARRATWRSDGDEIDPLGRAAVDAHLGAAQRQEIVDQPAHAPRLVEHDRAGIFPRPAGSLRAGPSSVSMKPVSEASGVRSSWLALATKSARMRAIARRSETSSKVTRMKPPRLAGRRERAQRHGIDVRRLARLVELDRAARRPASASSSASAISGQRKVSVKGSPGRVAGKSCARARRWRSARCRRHRGRSRPAETPRPPPSWRCRARIPRADSAAAAPRGGARRGTKAATSTRSRIAAAEKATGTSQNANRQAAPRRRRPARSARHRGARGRGERRQIGLLGDIGRSPADAAPSGLPLSIPQPGHHRPPLFNRASSPRTRSDSDSVITR